MFALLGAALSSTFSTAFAGPGITYEANTGEFGTDGPTWAEPADILKVTIADEDPRRVWDLQVDFKDPVQSGNAAVLATLKDIVMASAGGFKGGNAEVDLQIALSAAVQETETFIEQASATEQDLAALGEIYEVLEQAAEAYASVMGLEDLPEAPLSSAKDAMQVWRRIQQTAERARKSRTQEVLVKKGFQRVVVKTCHKQLDYVDRNLSWQERRCSSSTYILQVSNPGGALQLMPGWVIPIQDGEFAQGRALVAVGSSLTLHAKTQAKLGLDLGAAMGGGNLAPSAYTVGPHLSLAGISFGGGLAMVQSPVEDDNSFRAAPYLRVGLSPNFMDGVKAMTSEKGAQNADAPAQSEDEDLITVPATNTPPTLGPRGVESPDSDTDPAAEEADEESAETETTLPDSRPGTTPVITSPPRVP